MACWLCCFLHVCYSPSSEFHARIGVRERSPTNPGKTDAEGQKTMSSPAEVTNPESPEGTAAPLVVSFVSGKGGVGKTMLAVAFAKEMSLANPTLVIDLDFFNRGLTGLMGDGELIAHVLCPQFLRFEHVEAESEEWRLVLLSENLYHVSYPALSQREMQLFEELSVDKLKESLKDWVLCVAAECRAQCVVIDCHGGPDNSSFAACSISDYSLLVSEPDRITFFGTVNFLRALETVPGGERTDIRLIFNKVIPAFSALYLNSFYDRNMRHYFGDNPLAAIFPMEIYLTKAFEKNRFLTSVYPDSLLAKKTRNSHLRIIGSAASREFNKKTQPHCAADRRVDTASHTSLEQVLSRKAFFFCST